MPRKARGPNHEAWLESLRDKRFVTGVGTGTKGAANELLVSVDLIQRGFQVFRNLSPHGPFDLIAYKSQRILRIEVRSASQCKEESKRKGSNDLSWTRTKNPDFDLYALVTKTGEIRYRSWDKETMDVEP